MLNAIFISYLKINKIKKPNKYCNKCYRTGYYLYLDFSLLFRL